MFKVFKTKQPKTIAGIVSDENGTVVVTIKNPGNSKESLKTCEYAVNSVDSMDAKGQILSGQGLERKTCSTLLGIGDYQLLVVDAPEVSPQEMQAALRWKIQDLIDYHIDDAIIDTFEAPPGGPAGTLRQMYVVVAHSTVVRERIDKLESAGVNLKIIDIPELAIRNLAAKLPEDQLGLVTLYFSEQKCLITLTQNATLFLTRTVEFRYGDLNDGSVDAAGLTNRLALEIQRSLDYYEQHFRKATIQTIAILPPPISLDVMNNVLQGTLGLTIRSLEMDDVIDSNVCLDQMPAATCMLAVGCALRTVNSIP